MPRTNTPVRALFVPLRPYEDPFDRGYTGRDVPDEYCGGDGRRLRGERTRQHIAEAMIDLIEDGCQRPTAKAIAERAGVSLRLVFHHFEDVDTIFEMAATIQAGRHWRKMATIRPEGPTRRRIDALVRQRGRLYVAISPVREVVIARACDNPVIASYAQAGSRRLRTELATTFSPELVRAGADSGAMLDSMDLTTTWDAWRSLRVNGGKSAAAAQRIMAYSLNAILAATSVE